ncbi:alpha/beta hydrolase [Reichenbachiella carrageenanivorans]|uniref:Alpha/beta hydrolase n=1 Tax=Reichenbachiella carrageenanivorans TaxID=2979869 RepID=A0ABY6D6R1_9BACT|nr:alpha/beta hydrolase [Reichenbachiella carrageenanivorans]UXX79520.1 alpha/beta hydrolase [Reichenbachiella carrageenanivorans]
MKKTQHLFKYSPEFQLDYLQYGQGNQRLICFHGFGQEATIFEELSSQLTDYQIISIHLLFHGQSDRTHSSTYLQHKEWKAVLAGLLDHLNISRFSVLGYSMGGRYTISTIYAFANRVDHCLLIAPDGIVKRMSYELATFPYGPQQLFSYFMYHPKSFFSFLDLIEKTKLINPWTVKFSRSQLKEDAQRHRVFKSWITLKKLRLKQKALIALINKEKFKTHLIFGRYDRIIIPEHHQNFCDQLPSTQVSIIESAHHDLITHATDTIKQALAS